MKPVILELHKIYKNILVQIEFQFETFGTKQRYLNFKMFTYKSKSGVVLYVHQESLKFIPIFLTV